MSKSAQSKTYGVTPPISTAEPTSREVDATQDLVTTLKDLGLFESDQEARKREVVLAKLDSIFKEFVKRVGLSRGIPESMADEVGGKIFTFGSYRLGVHGKGSDIDTLCVAPKFVKREDFFKDMYDVLKARSEVTEITAVADAYVPVIKFQFSDIPIDLVFARLEQSTVPDNLDLADDNLLRGLDERCVRSLNGSRVTDDILRLVPNIDAFRIALRCIKLWAKKRAVYSNVMGFFGGVAWAILVARVCQLYPNAAAGAIVSKFFRIMHKWAWPQPVLLRQIEEGPLAVRVWNPKIYPQDKVHRMPIITPAYPSMCATHNVTVSTQRVTTQEFERAADIADRVMIGSAKWLELFTPSDFFLRYKYYLQVIASSSDPEAQLRWSGMVESRLRQLVMKLELVENLEIAHPYIKSFEKTCRCYTEEERNQAAHGQFPSARADQKAEGGQLLYTTSFYIGLMVKAKDPNSNAPRKLDISWPTREFVSMVRLWDKFDEQNMGIVVQYMKSVALPPEVFEGGEQPRTLKKRPKSRNRLSSSTDENPAKKRRASVSDSASPENIPSPPSNGDNEPSREESNGTAASEQAADHKSSSTPSTPGNGSSLNYSHVAALHAPGTVDRRHNGHVATTASTGSSAYGGLPGLNGGLPGLGVSGAAAGSRGNAGA